MEENYVNEENEELGKLDSSIETDDDFDRKLYNSLIDTGNNLDLGGIKDRNYPETVTIKYRNLSELPQKVQSIQEIKVIENTLSDYRRCGYQSLFRGHADASYDLCPTIVWKKVENYNQEKEILNELIDICNRFGYDDFRHSSFNKNLFYMAVGRHLGLYSRLLDWSARLWTSMSFIMNEEGGALEKDGALWILITESGISEERDPFSISDQKIHVLRENYWYPDNREPPLGILRREHQNGFFTVQAEKFLDVPFEKMARASGFELHKFIIPKETKAQLKGYKELMELPWLYVHGSQIIEKILQLNTKFKVK